MTVKNHAKPTIELLSYNLHRDADVTHSLLNHLDSMRFTALLVQEQHWTEYMKSSLIHHSWTLIEPSGKANGRNEQRRPRSAIYINNKLLSTKAFTPVTIPINDVTAITIDIEGHVKPTLVMSIYNDQSGCLINELRDYLHGNLNTEDYGTIIIAGDFNLHHPLWNAEGYRVHDSKADDLVEMMGEQGLRPLLPCGTITFPTPNEQGGTSIDLVWGNENAELSVLRCRISEDNDHGSDHYPIEICLNVQIKQVDCGNQESYDYTKTNWEVFKCIVAQRLPGPLDKNNLTPETIDEFAKGITDAIQHAICETTPIRKPCSFSKRWWNEDLTQLKRVSNRLRNRYKRTRNERDRQEWRSIANDYKLCIRLAKQNTWREFVEKADAKTIWTVKKYIDTIPTSTYIPTLDEGLAVSNTQKTEIFKSTFFPPPPPADLWDLSQNVEDIPPQVHLDTNITMQQMERAISKISPNKAPGPDVITNAVLKKGFSVLKHHLLSLAQGSFNAGHFPSIFKGTTTIVLRKRQRPDYTKPNAYRPIALECTIGKLLESIMAELISYITEVHELLPGHHYGGRPGRSAEDAMMVLKENIHAAWKESKIYSVVFMDVAGAFNNVHHERLIHNMRMRRIPETVTTWIKSVLCGRHTCLQFNGVRSETISTPAGVPQGSLLSPLLYMYYNSGALEVAKGRGLSLGFIDDITL